MKKAFRIFLYILAGLFVVGIIGRLTGNDKPATTTPEAVSELTKAQKDSLAKADAKQVKSNTIRAETLVGYYAENEIKADKDLKDKEFYVSGRVGAIGKDVMNNAYITLKSSDPVRSVQCYFDDSAPLAGLQKGQNVLIKGKCSGLMMNVLMKECTLQ